MVASGFQRRMIAAPKPVDVSVTHYHSKHRDRANYSRDGPSKATSAICSSPAVPSGATISAMSSVHTAS